MAESLQLLSQIGLISEKIADTPAGNICLRISGFGMRGSCALRRYIEAAWQIAEHRKPIIADCVAGNVGLSLAAFGAVGGICHRVAEPEIFNVANWRQGTRGGGQKKRIYAPKLDLFLPQEQALLSWREKTKIK